MLCVQPVACVISLCHPNNSVKLTPLLFSNVQMRKQTQRSKGSSPSLPASKEQRRHPAQGSLTCLDTKLRHSTKDGSRREIWTMSSRDQKSKIFFAIQLLLLCVWGRLKATKHFTSFRNYRACGKAKEKTPPDNYSLHQGAEVAAAAPSLLYDGNGLKPPYYFKSFHFPSLAVVGYFFLQILVY